MDTETFYDEKIAESTFENGDRATGEFYREMMTVFFIAKDKNGETYETAEIPAIRFDLR